MLYQTNDMRKAINVTVTKEVTVSLGRFEKKAMDTTRMIEIDNYGQIPSSSFIKRLVDRGRLAWEYRAKASHAFTNEFLTELLNKNEDLFEVQF